MKKKPEDVFFKLTIIAVTPGLVVVFLTGLLMVKSLFLGLIE